MIYEEAIKYLTPDPYNHGTILYDADKVREAVSAIENYTDMIHDTIADLQDQVF